MAATAQEPQKVTIENVENPDKAPMVAPKKKHTMTATWHLDEDQSEWDFYKRLIHRLNILQHPKGQAPAPVYTKDDKVPFYPVWRQWAYIMPRAVVPLLIHRAFMELTGWTFHPVFAFFFYAFAFKFFAIRCVRVFNRMGQKYGFFDGSHPRDGVPDLHSQKIGLSMLGTVTIRPLFATFLIYDRYEKPSLSLWFPVQMFIYSAVLDFWFYWYHRGMHEIPWLWKFHRLHHVTKHPNPLLSAFADNEQEWGDILVIPLLTWLVFPLNFSTWFMAQQFIIYTEIFGHSGVRLFWMTPMTGYILRWFEMDLCLEDHDQHHRFGWRNSSNYGKQTRLWDRLFGTTRSRIECREDNIDWVNTAKTG